MRSKDSGGNTGVPFFEQGVAALLDFQLGGIG
jgi:hypothetical protein